jgi:hypothetical protein
LASRPWFPSSWPGSHNASWLKPAPASIRATGPADAQFANWSAQSQK